MPLQALLLLAVAPRAAAIDADGEWLPGGPAAPPDMAVLAEQIQGLYSGDKQAEQCAETMKVGSKEVGLDLRACWGGMVEYAAPGRPVCGAEAMRELAEAAAAAAALETDSTGRSGSSIVTNIEGWVIKSVKDDEWRNLKSIFSRLRDRPKFLPALPALAPICAVLRDAQGLWMLMRKVKVGGGAKSRTLQISGAVIAEMDLKGPHWAKSLWHLFTTSGNLDFKTWFGADHGAKMKKDPGFARHWPGGLELAGPSVRADVSGILLATRLLAMAGMTDYSLLVTFYDTAAVEASSTQAAAKPLAAPATDPRFPLVLNVASPDGDRPMSMTVGIIDYLEKEVKDLRGSTMVEPTMYRRYFAEMWPKYFRLPNRDGVAQKPDTSEDIVETGQKAMLLQTTKKFKCKDTRGFWRRLVASSPMLLNKVYAGSCGTLTKTAKGLFELHVNRDSGNKVMETHLDNIRDVTSLFAPCAAAW